MEQSRVEIIGRYISSSRRSRFRVESVIVDGDDKTDIQHPNNMDMTQTSFTKTMIQVFKRLKLYRRAKLTITITETEYYYGNGITQNQHNG